MVALNSVNGSGWKICGCQLWVCRMRFQASFTINMGAVGVWPFGVSVSQGLLLFWIMDSQIMDVH